MTFHEENFREYFISHMKRENRISPLLNERLKQEKMKILGDLQSLKPLARENPAKVGDTVEKTWSSILCTLLPKGNFEILNKVIIQFDDNTRSPEIDLVIVKDMPELADRNYVNYDFVIAAFEVKYNLKAAHLSKIFETSTSLNKHKRSGTIQNELCRDIIYGVLAHTSSLSKAKVQDPDYHISYAKREQKAILEKISEYNWKHPTDLLDFIVVDEFFSLGCLRTVNYDEKYPCDWLGDIEVSYYHYLSSDSRDLNDVKDNDLCQIGVNNSVIGNLGYNLSKMLFYNQHLDYKLIKFYEHFASLWLQPVCDFNISIFSDSLIEQLKNPDVLREY